MKKVTKRLAVGMLALLMAFTIAPLSVFAAPKVASTQTVYRQSTKGTTWVDISVTGLSKKSTVSSVKSSQTSVLKKNYISYNSNTYSHKTSYYDKNIKGYSSSNSNYSAQLGFTTKKAGTSTVSFKIGSKSYKSKVTVKNYTNPIKTAYIVGIKNGSSTNLASMLKSQNNANLKLKSNAPSEDIKIQANSGWKIRSINMYDDETGTSYYIDNYNKGLSKVSFNVETLKKNQSASLYITMYNTKTNGTIECCYNINN